MPDIKKILIMLTGSSVAIIGGADGPTAVFVSKSSNIMDYILIAALAVVLVALIILFIKKKRHK